jgi:nicotinamidase-related amidase
VTETALLILDMQNELIDPKGKVGSKGFANIVAEKKLIEKIATLAWIYRCLEPLGTA